MKIVLDTDGSIQLIPDNDKDKNFIDAVMLSMIDEKIEGLTYTREMYIASLS